MRLKFSIPAATAALALSGCVVTTPIPGPAPVTPPTTTTMIPTTPTTLDAASRQLAQGVINAEMQKRLPGTNVTPYTSCIMQNATTAELIDIAQMSRAGASGAADSVAVIVKRPATTQCITAAARSA